MLSRLLIAAVLSLSAWGVDVRVADVPDWRSWRGPLGTGSVEHGNFPVAFSADKWQWRTELPGRGCSTPIVLDDKIYLTSPADGKNGRERRG